MTTRNEASARLIDARGLKCPWPVLRAARAMRECDAVDLLADDPVALVDVPALVAAHRWSVDLVDCGDFTRFQLRKTC
ncbi:MAG: sulfurtransferase TusA family protein [Sphingobium sp.]|nr:sulfurtransferase TusA family protein [Sphingobium sp.]